MIRGQLAPEVDQVDGLEAFLDESIDCASPSPEKSVSIRSRNSSSSSVDDRPRVSFASGTAPPSLTVLAISIPSHEISTSKNCIYYRIDVMKGGRYWCLKRRYSEFVRLRRHLLHYCIERGMYNIEDVFPVLPGRRWIWEKLFYPYDEEHTARRRMKLQEFLRSVAKVCINSHGLMNFLELDTIGLSNQQNFDTEVHEVLPQHSLEHPTDIIATLKQPARRATGRFEPLSPVSPGVDILLNEEDTEGSHVILSPDQKKPGRRATGRFFPEDVEKALQDDSSDDAEKGDVVVASPTSRSTIAQQVEDLLCEGELDDDDIDPIQRPSELTDIDESREIDIRDSSLMERESGISELTENHVVQIKDARQAESFSSSRHLIGDFFINPSRDAESNGDGARVESSSPSPLSPERVSDSSSYSTASGSSIQNPEDAPEPASPLV
jgi:hypothetical protein